MGDSRAPATFFDDSYSFLTTGKQLTRGNNVAAYDDNATTTTGNGNVGSSTNSPDGGANRDFDFAFNQPLGPRNAGNLAAGITNLFYWNNMLHDIMMSKGFDEVSGNFQYKNISPQGLGNDFVRAEAQDGSGRNNANFSTPNDGSTGRMQMYLFDNTKANALTVTGAPAAAGSYPFATVAFGPTLTKQARSRQAGARQRRGIGRWRRPRLRHALRERGGRSPATWPSFSAAAARSSLPSTRAPTTSLRPR